MVAKRRIDVAARFQDAAIFHAGQELPFAEAKALIESSQQRFQRIARDALGAFIDELRAPGLEVVASAVVAGAARPLPELRSIFASHALVHAAEGQFYRSLFAEAAGACRVPALPIPAKELTSRAARARGLSAAALAERLAEIGKRSGKPWAADQKESALAAWIALGEPP